MGAGHAAVVGAGPAGEAATWALLAAGWRVSVFDEQPRPGGNIGRIRRNAPATPLERGDDRLHLHQGARVLRVDGDGTVEYRGRGGITAPRFDGIVLACGAYDLHTPIPGTPAPGVCSAGALQALMKGQGVVPAGRVMIAGAGPFLYVAAAGLLRAGAQVTTVVDRLGMHDYARLAPLGIHATGDALAFARDQALLRRHGVRLLCGHRLETVEDGHAVLDDGERLAFDRLGLTEGFAAQSQLARTAGCELRWHEPGGYFVTVTDEWGRSSVPGVLVCGEGQGVRGWRHARVSGELAAHALLADREGQVTDATRYRRLLRRRARFARFGEALERMIATGRERPAAEAVLCACESVPAAEVEAAADLRLQDLSSIKVVTRCGMGPCQGRYCEPHVARCIERAGGRPRGALNQRGLTRPVTAGELAHDS